MMLRYLSVVVLVIAVSVFPEWVLRPYVEKSFGYAAYSLNQPANTSTDYQGNVNKSFVESELDYPMDQVNAGLRAEYLGSVPGKARALLLSAEAFARVTQPVGKMIDNDWMGVSMNSGAGFGNTATQMRFNFSSTQSRVKILYYGGALGASMELFTLAKRPVSLGLSGRYEHLYSDVFGVKGWQYAPSDTTDTASLVRFDFDTLQGQKVLTYKADYVMISLLASMPLVRGPVFGWGFDVEFSPLSFAWDEDYHLLRHKRINSIANGVAFAIDNCLGWKVSPQLRIELLAGLRYIRNTGSMEQYWYADEASDGVIAVPQGTRLTNIPSKIFSFTRRIALGVAWTL